MGPSSTKLILVGEAPGQTEAKTGKVFVGPSGKLLDSVLAHYGLRRNEAFITNTVACRPPDNRQPSKDEISRCSPRLMGEIDARLQPNGVVVPLGNTANQTITGTREGITKARVGLPRYDEQKKRYIIPTIHPAACLRNADSFPFVVADFQKVADAITGTVRIKWEPPVYAVFDEQLPAERALDQIGQEYDDLVVDIECGFEKDTEDDHPDEFDMLCVGIGYAPGKVAVIGEEALKYPSVIERLKRLLRRKKWTAHNGKFDLAGLRRYGDADLYFDTMLASYALDERPSIHGLKYLSTELLGAPHYDEDIKRYVRKGDSYALVPRDKLYRYNAYDAGNTYALREIFRKRLKEDNVQQVHDFLVKASDFLMHTEIEGMAIDLEYLDFLTEHYLDILADIEKPLEEWVANPRSPKQVKEALHALDVYIPKKKNQKGVMAESTDEETLLWLNERAEPGSDANRFIDLMLTHRREQKLYGTYVKGTRKRLRKGRVHPTFRLHGTTSGRLACRNPNLQNVPRESSIRRLFVPVPGNIFVQADYATIELRVLATLAKDMYLKQIFDQGRDIHNEFSTRFYGPNFTKDQRIRTKAFIFGLAYGREAHSIAVEFKISEHEAQRQMDEFFAAIPGVVAFRNEVERSILEDQEDLVTQFGRHRRFWLITRENQKDVVKEGLSFLPQSTASDICMTAAMRLYPMLPPEARIRLLVHDSIMVECPEDMRYNIGRLMSEVMTQTAREVFSDFVPFPVDVEFGKSWGDLKHEEITA